MSFMDSRPKKSPSSKAQPKPVRALAALCERRSRPVRGATHRRSPTAAPSQATNLRRESRAWRAAQPTALERDTLLVPEWIAESVVQEVERFLDARLREDFAERLAAKAHYLYPRHGQFHRSLNRPGNRGRDNLFMYMRHWTCAWLKRERPALYRHLPWEYALGRRLPRRKTR